MAGDLSRDRKMKICMAASAGGHLTQLLNIANAFKNYEVFYVSTLDSIAKTLEKKGTFYLIGECNREHPFQVILVFFRCIKIILSKRPNVIISTGAAPGYLLCLVGKLFGAKIVWLDSIANTEKLSMSGRMIRPFADLILSQWPDVAAKYKNVEFAGAVI